MKMFRSNMAKLAAIALAACSGTSANAQTVEQAAEGSYSATASHSDYDVNSSAMSQPCYDTRSLCVPRKYCGPTMYFQAEAMFLSRRYDVAPTAFGLESAGVTLLNANRDGLGNLTNINWDVENLTGVDSALLDDNFGEADQLTGIPRLTLGIVGDSGWGIQGRYWRMENSVGDFGLPVNFSGFAPYPSAGGLTDEWRDGALSRLAGFEQFSAETIDLELTRDFRFRGWSGLATFGVRHGAYNNSRINTVDGGIATGVPGIAGGGTLESAADTYHTADYDLGSRQASAFRGTGFTTSLTAMRALTYNPEFALFASIRGSVLYGYSDNTAQTYAAMESFYTSSWDSDVATIRSGNEQYMTELQLGTQWSRNVRFLNGRMFARAAFEYQFWRNNVAQAESDVFVGDHGIARSITGFSGEDGGIGRTQGRSFARGLEQDFDMIGASFAAGFAF